AATVGVSVSVPYVEIYMSLWTCQVRHVNSCSTLPSMSLRHALLGLLAVAPATGYELAQKFDVSMGTAWHASHRQIYPELARLHEAGMVEVVGEGARNSRTYAVTDAGREEIRAW